MSFADSRVFGVDGEEVFQRFTLVVVCAEVRQVIAKLHGFGVQVSVRPSSEHRDFWGRHGVSTVSVSGIFEMFEGDDAVGFCGVEVVGNAGGEIEFRAAGIVHLQFDGAQRTIVLSHLIHLGHPPAVAHCSVCVEPGSGVSVGAVDKATVCPVGSPGVHDNPCAFFIGGGFAVDAVAVQVKLNAVIVAHDGQCVVHAGAPFLHVFLSDHSGFRVGGR